VRLETCHSPCAANAISAAGKDPVKTRRFAAAAIALAFV